MEAIEENIRNIALTKRIRATEFFIDYDQLRSGFVTASQFARVIWENLGVKLNDDDMKLVTQRYDLRGDGRTICYRAFCDAINRPIDPNNMNVDLATQVKMNGPQNLLGSCRTVRLLSPRSENQVLQVLGYLQSYYKKHGISLLKCCEDFDRHHIGVIQESQFYRSFPHPSDIIADDVAKLVKRYADPTRPGMINYVNMHRDIEALVDENKGMKSGVVQEPLRKLTKPTYSKPGETRDTQEILEKLQAAAQRNRVRTTDFFKDFDKLRSGVITESQFQSALHLAVGKEAQLSSAEVQQVIEFYRVDEGRVNYRDFCSMIENAFTIPELEKKPLLEVPTLTTDALGRNLPQLSDAEECRVNEVLEALAEQVRKRHLQLLSYFQDYEKGTGFRRVVSPTQFYRVLQFANLSVAPEDLKLLVHKFREPLTGDINYTDFVRIVDPEFFEKQNGVSYSELDDRSASQTNGVLHMKGSSRSSGISSHMKENVAPSTQAAYENVDDILARIRHLVLTTRRRIADYFQDFDQLRSGSVTKTQFRRALSDLGMNSIGIYNMSTAQFEALAAHYLNPKMPDKVLWVQFMKDVECALSPPNLEKIPTAMVPDSDLFVLPKEGTVNWANASDDHRALCEKAMQHLQSMAKQRRLPVKPTFRDFDKHRNGHITRKQFRQALTMIELPVSEAEMQALEAKFCNDTGFDYMSFLAELQPEDAVPFMYVKRMEQLRQVNEKGALPEHNPSCNFEALLDKMRTKVFRERIRVYEWMKDYDKLHVGRIPRANFQRALDLCKFELTKSEIGILLDHYAYNGLDTEYLRFCEDIEAIFAKAELEKMPLVNPDKAKPYGSWTQTKELPVLPLSPEKEGVAYACLQKIAEQVRKTRLQLYPLFEDFDRIHNGTIPISQFRRVLVQLELAGNVRGEYEWECLTDKFMVKGSGKDVINYVSFCDNVYEFANFEWRKP